MSTILASFVIVALAVAAMAIGVMLGRKPIRGSCGGVASEGCELCSGGPCDQPSAGRDAAPERRESRPC